jgi:hypothetical protein
MRTEEVAMLIGAHSIVYSKNADADREFLRKVIGLAGVDVGGGWLIFGLPPAEVAVHPGDENDVHEFYLMTDDVEGFVGEMSGKGVACEPVRNLGWGLLTQVVMPGGGKMGVYQPRHARPEPMGVKKKAAAKKKAATKKEGGKKRR